MSGNKFAITPKLPAQLTGTAPIVVTKSGVAYNISFGAMTGSVSKRQFFGAVSTRYSMTTLFAAITANPESNVWWQFYGGSYIVPGDPIAALTQSTFSLTNAQMANLFALAETLPY
jgi:hypothetical protein